MSFPATSAPLARALAERDYNDPTPVQSAVLAPDAEGRDLLVSAQTGSGKTVAYGLALASTLLGDADTMGPAGDPLALVIAPTRELALQVQQELDWLYRQTGARVVACVGGMDPRREARLLASGVHIVVGTPGRLRDHLERGALRLGALAAAVLDEADEMLDMGFREDLEFILDATPAGRRTLLFSATLPRAIVNLARRYQQDALRLEVSAGAAGGHADIEYRAVRVAPRQHELAVVNLLRFFEAPGAIVFCNTREAVRHLQATLLERGFTTVALSGELSQNERNHAIQALRDGHARVCVATDVAARGIDLAHIGLVVHADLPHDAEVLQHRSGRTGRAGRKGVSVVLVPVSRRRSAERLFADARIKPEWSGPPTAEEIRALDQERLFASPLLTGENTEEDAATAEALMQRLSPEAIAAALVRLHRERLPAPEDVVDPGDSPRRPYADRGAERNAAPSADHRGADRGPRPESGAPRGRSGPAGATVWFKLDVGRTKNADPRWLLPIICRQGKVTKQEIGAIRVFERETKFEIDEQVADRFMASVRAVPAGGEVRIEPLADAMKARFAQIEPDVTRKVAARPAAQEAPEQAAPERAAPERTAPTRTYKPKPIPKTAAGDRPPMRKRAARADARPDAPGRQPYRTR